MSFSLSSHQQSEISKLELDTGRFDNDDELYTYLEACLSEGYIKGPNDKTKPIINVQKDLFNIAEQIKELSRASQELHPDMQHRLSDLISASLLNTHDYFELSTRYDPISLDRIYNIMIHYIESVRRDFEQAYGKSKDHKAIWDLFPFWYGLGYDSVFPISNEGKFVRLVSIVLEKDVEAARKTISRVLENRKALGFKDKDS